MMKQSINEHNKKESSDRAFGIIFGLVFLFVGCLPSIRFTEVQFVLLSISFLFILLSLTYPQVLAPLNQMWMKFGEVLHKIMNPVILAFIFFGCITPIAIILRILRKETLKLRFDKASDTYWIKYDNSQNNLKIDFREPY